MATRRARNLALSTTATSQQILGPNEARVALIISSDGTRPVSLSFGVGTVVGLGLRIATNGPPKTITKELIGHSITEAVHAVSTGPASIPVIEVSEL